MMNSHIPSRQRTSSIGNNRNKGGKKNLYSGMIKTTMRKVRASKSNEDGKQDREIKKRT